MPFFNPSGKGIDFEPLAGADIADGDYVYVIDISDTTQSPTGTLKLVKKSELVIAIGALSLASGFLELATTKGVKVDGDVVVTDRQVGFAASAAESAGVGADTVDLITLNATLAEHKTILNAIRTILNAHGLTTTV